MNRRITTDRRLQNLIFKDERRFQIRRNLEEFRREKEERRKEDLAVTEDRRVADRRREEIEKLRDDNPEHTIPLKP
jgi:hypothetical protein